MAMVDKGGGVGLERVIVLGEVDWGGRARGGMSCGCCGGWYGLGAA